MQDEATSLRSSLLTAVLFTVVGAVGLAYAYATRSHPLDLLPGLDGTLVCGGMTLLVGLGSGRSYRETVTMMVPIAAVQAASCALSRASMPAVLGLEALVVGLVGLALYLAATWGQGVAPARESAPAGRHVAA